KPHTEEWKEKVSTALSGENNPNFGKPLTDETKQKISESMIGKNNGENNPMFGKKHSEETLNKMSEAKKGKTWEIIDGKRVYKSGIGTTDSQCVLSANIC